MPNQEKPYTSQINGTQSHRGCCYSQDLLVFRILAFRIRAFRILALHVGEGYFSAVPESNSPLSSAAGRLRMIR